MLLNDGKPSRCPVVILGEVFPEHPFAELRFMPRDIVAFGPGFGSGGSVEELCPGECGIFVFLEWDQTITSLIWLRTCFSASVPDRDPEWIPWCPIDVYSRLGTRR